MSTNTQEESHTGPIKTGKQFFWVAIAAFVVPFFTAVGLAVWIDSANTVSVGSTEQAKKLLERIQPVARVAMESDAANEPDQQGAPAPQAAATSAPAAAAGGADAGKALYESTCVACHGAGVAGAPKFGDKAAWAPLIASGMDAMMQIAIHGKGAMPPRGGSQASDEQLKQTVEYMVSAAGGAAAPAAAAPAPEPEQKPAETAPAAAKSEAAQPAAAAAPEVDLAAGEALYKSTCFACHGTGVAGAPKFGDKAAWAPLIASGMDAMMNIAIHGKGAMPARGGSQASDEQLRAAVQFMVNAAH